MHYFENLEILLWISEQAITVSLKRMVAGAVYSVMKKFVIYTKNN